MTTRVQTLLNVVALCPACHEATHFGFVTINDRDDVAMAHLMKVNNWTSAHAEKHIKEAGDLWTRRSEIEDWKLDVRWILNFVTLSEESKSKILAYANDTKVRAV